MTSSEKIDFARRIVANIPAEHCGMWASAVGHTIGSLDRWRDAELAAETARARDLDAALIIADHVDGDPDDYIDAIPALREHLAQDGAVDAQLGCGFRFSGGEDCRFNDGHTGDHHPAEPIDWTAQANTSEAATAVPEPPVGTRLRDKRGNVWERRDAAHKFCWSSDGITPPYTFDLLMQHHGPLHEVYESWADIPAEVRVVGTDERQDVKQAGQCDCALCKDWERDAAPFTAVTPYPTTQIGAHDE